ncbi:MAG: ABC transporter permease [Spirochaetaceae bacterium]|jgi:lipopolysaccharide transport system permease protein|nr:ABC transporter permease [Spirochaetaceae bacterium]
MKCRENKEWSLVITPKRRLFDLQIRDIIRYRDLVFLLVQRDFAVQYKQTILGPLWYVLNPRFSTVMYSFVFGNLAKIGTDGIPFLLFYYSGTMLWTFFTGCFTNASELFIANADIFSKVYFPRLTVPISNVFGNGIRVLVQFVMLMGFFVYYLVTGATLSPSLPALAFPALLVWIAALGTGMGMIVSALTTKYRDLKQLVTFALNLAMYITPVVYPLSQIPGSFAWLVLINPLSAPMELFRLWFFGAGSVSPSMILVSLGMTMVFVLLGLILFNQNERNFVDVV